MQVNPHIKNAIQLHAKNGRDFHDVLTWHLLHGVVYSSPEFLCLGYYCMKDNLRVPRRKCGSDCGFVTFMSGSMAALRRFVADDVQNIAFERGFKNMRPARAYSLAKIESLLTK
jgi:hypothetical protein